MNLELLKKRFDRVFGAGALASASEQVTGLEVIPTGISMLDNYVIGRGGIPRGRITMLSGKFSSGKSFIAYKVIANAQKAGLSAALIDAEAAYSPDWGAEIGINNDELLLPKFKYAEEAWRQIHLLADAGCGVIVVDSVARLVPRTVLESVESGKDARPGEAARVNRAALGALIQGTKELKPLRETGTALILLDHMTQKIGGYSPPGQEALTLVGGTALEYDPHLWIFLKTIGWERDPRGGALRQRVRARCLKNRLGPPLRQCDLWLDLKGEIFDDWETVVDVLVDQGYIVRKGAFYTVGETTVRGKQELVSFLQTKEGTKFLDEVFLQMSVATSSGLDDEMQGLDIEVTNG